MNMFNIAKRNITLFFRDRMAVFFSLLTVIIIIGLYVLFLGDMMANVVRDNPYGRYLADSWIVAGLVASCSVTATLGAYGVIVNDQKRNIIKDFKSSPIKFYQLTGGYILSAFTVGIIMSTFTLFLGQIYILINGGNLFTLKTLIFAFLIIILTTFMNSAVLFFIMSFTKSESAFGTLSTVIGTIIGFLLGIYIPIGSLPNWVQSVMKVFPGSYSVSLLRSIIMEKPIDLVFANVPDNIVSYDWFVTFMGLKFSFDGFLTTPLIAVLVMLGTGILFFGLSILKLSIKTK